MKKILLFVLLISSMLTASMIPVCAAQTYTLNVGETKTLYPTSTIGKNIKSGAWISNQPFNVKITSYTGSTTRCVIEAENPTVGSKAVVQFTYYYYITSGTFTYLASGCEDFYIIVNSLEPTEVTIPSSVKFEGFEEVKKLLMIYQAIQNRAQIMITYIRVTTTMKTNVGTKMKPYIKKMDTKMSTRMRTYLRMQTKISANMKTCVRIM